MKYQHTQVGKIMIAAVIMSMIIALIAILNQDFSKYAPDWLDTSSWNMWGIVILIVAELFAINMTVLTLRINEGELTWQFGIGIPKGALNINDIVSVELVRNKWWYGFGIRRTSSGARLYNVEGLDAIEIINNEGAKIRFGTNDPKKLLRVLSSLTDNNEVV